MIYKMIAMLFFILLLLTCDDKNGLHKHRLYIKTKYYIVKEIDNCKYLLGKKQIVKETIIVIHNPHEFFELNKEQRKTVLDGVRTKIKCENNRGR